PNRHSRFEQKQRGIAVREYSSAQCSFDRSVATDDIHSVIRIARVADHLLIFFQPAVYLVPIKRRMALESGSVVDRVHIRPDRVLLTAVADLEVPVPSFALVRAETAMRAFDQEVSPYVGERKVVDG